MIHSQTLLVKTPIPLADIPRISVLCRQVYFQTYGIEGISWEFHHFTSRKFNEQRLHSIIREEPEQLSAAYYLNNPVGISEVDFSATCKVEGNAKPELSKLYVLERFYGKGVGHLLLNHLEECLSRRGYDKYWLEVLQSNERAIAFYRKHQFEIIGEADFPMEENTYRNYIMQKSI